MRWLFSAAFGKDYRPVIGLGPARTSWWGTIDKDDLAPIRHLRNLRQLDLANNEVRDEALEHVGELPNLEFIWVYGDTITGDAFQLEGIVQAAQAVSGENLC